MSLSELTLNPPLWHHKGADQCCNCYRWGATFDCLDSLDDLGNDWSFTGEWTLSPELSAADADQDPSTYQVTFEWKVNSANRYSWVPISSDWHDQLGTAWKAAHPGWLEQGRQLCNGCMMSAPTSIGTPGQTITYNCDCRRALSTIVPEASAQLSNTILGSDSFHIFFKVDSSAINIDDKWRINIHSNYKIEVLKHSESYYDLRLLDQDDEIIDSVEYSAGPWFHVCCDATLGRIQLTNGVAARELSVHGGRVSGTSLTFGARQFSISTTADFTGALKISEIYLYTHENDDERCAACPEIDASCLWYQQGFDIASGTVGDFSDWSGTVPVVNGHVVFPAGASNQIYYTGSRPSAWHCYVAYDLSGAAVGTKLFLRYGSNWSVSVEKGEDGTALHSLNSNLGPIGQYSGQLNSLLELSVGSGRVVANQWDSHPISYDATPPAGNISISCNGLCKIDWFSVYRAESEDPYCAGVADRCELYQYRWDKYRPNTTSFVGWSKSGSWLSDGATVKSSVNGSALTVYPYNPALHFSDWYGWLHLELPDLPRTQQFSLKFGNTLTWTYYPGGALSYNAAWSASSHSVLTESGTVVAIDWSQGQPATVSWYYDDVLGRLHVHNLVADVTLTTYSLGIVADQVSSQPLVISEVGYWKAIEGCADVPTSCPSILGGSLAIEDMDALNGWSGSWSGTYTFDRVADACLCVAYDAGEKRISKDDAWWDLRGITVEYDDTEDEWLVRLFVEGSGSEIGEIQYRASGDECAGSWNPTWTFLGTELGDLYGIVDYLNCSLTLTLE